MMVNRTTILHFTSLRMVIIFYMTTYLTHLEVFLQGLKLFLEKIFWVSKVLEVLPSVSCNSLAFLLKIDTKEISPKMLLVILKAFIFFEMTELFLLMWLSYNSSYIEFKALYLFPPCIVGVNEFNDPNLSLEDALLDNQRVDYHFRHLYYLREAIK